MRRNSAQFRHLCLTPYSHPQVYETTITNIQLQEQLKVTKNYQKDVTRGLKEVDVLQSCYCFGDRPQGRARCRRDVRDGRHEGARAAAQRQRCGNAQHRS